MSDYRQLGINTLRVLSVEAIEKANSGHPGLPLGAAPMAFTLFSDFLKYNPKNPSFENRDRFVMSAGHGSALYYSLLHLFGYDVSMEDLKKFRQTNSKTPGHPERGITPGVEISTGPLGQGIANAVGLAMAEKHLAAVFNRPGYEIVNHHTYALCGDGCLQEGISYEAASLAGTLKLSKLVVLYDRNKITIEGSTDLAFTENVGARFKAQGWNVYNVKDGNNLKEIKSALQRAVSQDEKPTIIICNTVIGYGSPLAGNAKVHGSPLGEKNLQELKKTLKWKEKPFTVPAELAAYLKKYPRRGSLLERRWKELFSRYEAEYPELAKEYKFWMSGEIDLQKSLKYLTEFSGPDSTRNTSSTVLNKLADLIPNLFGGSADLGPSNKTVMNNREYFSAEHPEGSNIHFGIREHAMAAICNGIAAHGGLIPYCSTFFVFTDYMKNAMRMSALMNLRVLYITTHDSIGVGEDGPTHQPIEQLAGLRAIPNLNVIRPADGKETVFGYLCALRAFNPTVLVLSRQNLPQYENSNKDAMDGAYILSDCEGVPDCILIASGSEVELCMKAQKFLKEEREISTRVVSVPCMDIFDQQDSAFRNTIIPKEVKARVCVEAGSSMCWYKYAGDYGEILAMDSFGTSGKTEDLFKKFEFTVNRVCEKVYLSLYKTEKE